MTRILLVEDNEEVGEFARTLLEELGHRVTFVCYTGAEDLATELPAEIDVLFVGAFPALLIVLRMPPPGTNSSPAAGGTGCPGAFTHTGRVGPRGAPRGRPRRHRPALDLVDPSAARAALAEIADRRSRLPQELPSQYEYFATLRGTSTEWK